MATFPIIATVLSMVLGLSVTRLLIGLVTVFRIRRTARPDWVPVAWAVVLFAIQLEYWWAINELPTIKTTFSFPEFLFLVLLTLMLFVSAALLLPSRSEDEKGGLRVYFEQDGRYALLFLSAFLALGFVVNVLFLRKSAMSYWAALDIVMIALPMLASLAKARKIYAAITFVYVPIAAYDVFISVTN